MISYKVITAAGGDDPTVPARLDVSKGVAPALAVDSRIARDAPYWESYAMHECQQLIGPLFALVVQRYMIEVMPHKAKGTVVSQRGHIKYWLQAFGQRPIRSITARDVSAHREALKASRTPTTVKHYLTTLSHIFTVAIREWEYLDANPCEKVRKPSANPGRVRFLSPSERLNLLAHCKLSRNRDLYAGVLLALCSGMRRGEIEGLTWERVHLDARLVDLFETKNGKARRVPMSQAAADALREVKVRHMEERILYGETLAGADKVFPLKFREAWCAAVKRAEIEDFRFHDLRHSCASELAMGGVDPLTIAEILGHSSMQMVKRYAHLNTAHLSAAIDGMATRTGL